MTSPLLRCLFVCPPAPGRWLTVTARHWYDLAAWIILLFVGGEDGAVARDWLHMTPRVVGEVAHRSSVVKCVLLNNVWMSVLRSSYAAVGR